MDRSAIRGSRVTPAELSDPHLWLDAAGNKLTLDACHETTADFVSGTTVSCTFDFYGLRADETARPYRGSYFLLTVVIVRVHITRAVQYWRSRSSRLGCGNPSRTGCPGTIQRTPR